MLSMLLNKCLFSNILVCVILLSRESLASLRPSGGDDLSNEGEMAC